MEHPQPVVARENDGAVPVLVQLQIGTPLVEKGVRRPAEVDVGGEPPFVRGQNSCQFEDDEPGLNGGLAGIEDSLVPRRTRELEGDDNAHAAVVICQRLLRLDARTPCQVNDLE